MLLELCGARNAAACCSAAQGLKEIAGDIGDPHSRRRIAAGQVERTARIRGNAGKYLRVRAVILQRGNESRMSRCCLEWEVQRVERYQLIRSRERQRPKERRVDRTEDCRVRS